MDLSLAAFTAMAGTRPVLSFAMQGRTEDLASVVKSLQKSFGIEYIYAWHGLSAYWSGVAPASEAPGMAKYNSRILYAQPTPGLAEIEPSMSWNPSVISGIGAPEDPAVLFNDMHSYLASSGETSLPLASRGVDVIAAMLLLVFPCKVSA